MNHTHILFVYKQFPAPSVGHAGGESLYRLMDGLRRRGHKISLVAGICDGEKAHLPLLRSMCEHVYTVPHARSLPGPRWKTVPQSYLALRRKTRQAILEARPDLLHVETLQTAVALLGLRRPSSSYRTQDVNWFLFDQRITRSRGLRRAGLRIVRAGFRWLEAFVVRHNDLILAISKGDQRLLASVCETRPLLFVPLGTPMPASVSRDPAAAPSLLFVGAMSRRLNVEGMLWFLRGVWPVVREAVPEVRLHIVGGHPPPELRAWDDGERVFVPGFVDDLGPCYEEATVFISPLLVAGGLLQKVMDALWMGVPVVATSVCNTGLGAEPGVEIVTADTERAFADAVIALLRDPVRSRQLGLCGQAYVKQHFDVEPALDRWSQALDGLAGDA